MDERVGGVSDVAFIGKTKMCLEFVAAFAASVIEGIERERAGRVVARDDELRLPMHYVLPEGIREELPCKQRVVDFLGFALCHIRCFHGFDVRIEDVEGRADEVTVVVRRKGGE